MLTIKIKTSLFYKFEKEKSIWTCLTCLRVQGKLEEQIQMAYVLFIWLTTGKNQSATCMWFINSFARELQ